MITMGCDIGSLFTKAVILDEDELIFSSIIRTTGDIVKRLDDFLDSSINEAGLTKERIDCLAGTGNGADLIKRADFYEDDITCVGAAASYYLEDVELVIEIGGQSISSLLVDEEGLVTNFMRNDKCASGSGRFLEMMGAKLKIKMDDVDPTVFASKNPVSISDQCAVFAESEVIGYVNAGNAVPDIFAGICASIANMVVAQGRRFGTEKKFTVTGGVARFEAIVNIISGKLNGEYYRFPFDQRLTAAIGAALLGDSE